MKSKLFLVLLSVILVLDVSAQRRREKDFYELFASDLYIRGDKNYSYIYDSDDNKLYDGLLTLKATTVPSAKRFSGVFGKKVRTKATLSMNVNCKKGYLHGPFSVNYNITETYGAKRAQFNSFYKGAFLDGKPNGFFNIQHKTGWLISLKATFKKGIAVGNFNLSGVYTVRGKLSQTGVMLGSWTYEGPGSKEYYNFKNGVLVSTNSDMYFDDNLKKYANKLALKQITEEELRQLGIEVYTQDNLLVELAVKALLTVWEFDINDFCQGYDFNIRTKPVKRLRYIQ